MPPRPGGSVPTIAATVTAQGRANSERTTGVVGVDDGSLGYRHRFPKDSRARATGLQVIDEPLHPYYAAKGSRGTWHLVDGGRFPGTQAPRHTTANPLEQLLLEPCAFTTSLPPPTRLQP
ncbi:hypothetical protein CC78DRAFT_580939 [Lojkania enalia]|uniref:Uncharacterized protein n=1 Tax=Lojkania enalia TaxID=147567 RepID=A0A9P4KA01_9PLEO|nr:hypothetical protein CC78DRAFT_580939 [Didymosphaeria enalia]